jgi:hypothetical protein
MKKLNSIFSKYWKLELKEVILSIIFLVTIVALVYFSMWGADILGLLNN